MTICSKCKNYCHTMVVKVCKQCGKSSNLDPNTLKYCTTCATSLGVCRACGKKLKPRAKTVTLNLMLKTTSFPVFNIVDYIRLLPGVIKAEQAFPDEDDPRLAAICLVKVEASQADAVIKVLKREPDVESAQIAPLRKVQKRKK